MGAETNKSMLTVACVYRPGPDFTDEYAGRLKATVAANCKEPHKFVCLTNVELPGIETIRLTENLKGYWNKLEIFRNGLFEERVVYIDLDTMIVNDVTDILSYPHIFTAGYNFKRKHVDSMASWFMAFDGRDDYSYLIDEYTPATPEQYEHDWARWGDQGYTQDHLRRNWTSIDDIFPGRCASYKWEVRRPGKVPDGVSFVAFHGKPRCADVNWRLPNGD